MKTNRLVMIAVLIGMAMSVSAQSESKYGADSLACIQNISLYTGDFKQWKETNDSPENVRPEMIAAWREVWKNCPGARQSTYLDAEKIVRYLISKDPSSTDAYIDTLCMLMDLRAEYFPNDPTTGNPQVARIMGNKGYLIYNLNKNRYEEAYNVLKDAVALDPTQLQALYLDAYFRATIDMVNNGKTEKMTVINVYQELSEALDDNIKVMAESVVDLEAAKAEADSLGKTESIAGFDKQIEKNEKSIVNYKKTKNNIDNLFQPFASCDDLIKVFSAKMAEIPSDRDQVTQDHITMLKRITTILDKKDCTDSKFFLDAAVKLNDLEPSPEASYSLGVKFFKDKEYSKAATFFDQATKTENNDRRYRAYRNLAICYQNMGNFSRARDLARRAAQVDPTAGEPYLIIAQLYAESARQFDDELKSKAVYWAAVDKCQKAKQIDPSVADRANSFIRAYSAAFPPMEKIFFNGYEEGQPFTVGGWIGETTTIRAMKK